MEITFRGIRIRNYIKVSLLRAEKNAESLYINKFHPEFNWKVGNLKDEQILRVLNYYSEYKELPEYVKTNSSTAKAFSLLVALYNEVAEDKAFSSLSTSNWLEIRSKYEAMNRLIYEKTYGTIGFNDSFNYSDPKNGKIKFDDEDFTNLINYTITSSNEETAVTPGETDLIAMTCDDIEKLLDQFHQGDWFVKLFLEKNDNYNYHLAIVNLNLPENRIEKILNEALIRIEDFFIRNGQTCSFDLRYINDSYFIDGYLLLEE